LDIFTKLLILEGNETNSLSKNGENLYSYLLIDLFKSKYDIRYCTNDNCSCQPETRIREILEDEEIKGFLMRERMFDKIIKYINDRNMKITVFDKYKEVL